MWFQTKSLIEKNKHTHFECVFNEANVTEFLLCLFAQDDRGRDSRTAVWPDGILPLAALVLRLYFCFYGAY